eukprot:gene7533-8969_t
MATSTFYDVEKVGAWSDLECHLKPVDISDAALQNLLDYACSPSGGVDCAPINPGGDHYPCTLYECTDYAVSTYYANHKPKFEWQVDQTCFFSGLAYATPPRPYHFMLLAGKGELNATDMSTNVMSKKDSAVQGQTLSYTIKNLTLTFNEADFTHFSLWIGASATGALAQLRVHYDFDGDGTWDRNETFGGTAVTVTPDYFIYSDAGKAPTGAAGNYADLKNGAVKIELVSRFAQGTDFITLLEATQQSPSWVTIPYHA